MRCVLCASACEGDLCPDHDKNYIYEKEIDGFRYRQRGRGSRYRNTRFNKNEVKLAKIIEKIFGKDNVVCSYRPTWAISFKFVLYEFDIHVKGTNIVIEYNGQQHYEYNKFFHKTPLDFEYQKLKDAHKSYLSLYNNYNLIVFKYDEAITLNYVKYKLEKILCTPL